MAPVFIHVAWHEKHTRRSLKSPKHSTGSYRSSSIESKGIQIKRQREGRQRIHLQRERRDDAAVNVSNAMTVNQGISFRCWIHSFPSFPLFSCFCVWRRWCRRRSKKMKTRETMKNASLCNLYQSSQVVLSFYSLPVFRDTRFSYTFSSSLFFFLRSFRQNLELHWILLKYWPLEA